MPKDNSTSNNSNQGVAWYIKSTSDTIDFLKGIPVNVLANPDNVKVFDNYVKIKSGGLNMVIPIVNAAGGRKAWDEAIARGDGDVVQDLAVSSAAAAFYVWAFGSNPVGWGAVAVGSIALGITWLTSSTDTSFGAYLEDALINFKNSNKKMTIEDIISNSKIINLDNHVTKFEIKDYKDNILAFDKQGHASTVRTNDINTQKQAIQILTTTDDIKQITLNSHTYDIQTLSNLEIRNALDNIQ